MASNIGGQAVLEGVMMRGPRNWAVAVRKPDGQIAHVAKPIDPLMARHWTLRLPVVRGVVALGESLSIGFRALSVSANYAAQEETGADGEPVELGRWALAFAFLVAIGFAVMIFKVGPALLTDLLPISNGGWFVLVEGAIRVTVFVLYLTILSFIPSLRRVFQYHAAEHKAINAYEAGEELDAGGRAALLVDPPALRHRVPALGDGRQRLRLRAARSPRLVLADRQPDRAPTGDRGDRVRADPLRRVALRQPGARWRSSRPASGCSGLRRGSRPSTSSKCRSARCGKFSSSRAGSSRPTDVWR